MSAVFGRFRAQFGKATQFVRLTALSIPLGDVMKHGHGQLGNHIIMVPLRILRGGGGKRYFYESLMTLYFFYEQII